MWVGVGFLYFRLVNFFYRCQRVIEYSVPLSLNHKSPGEELEVEWKDMTHLPSFEQSDTQTS